MNKSFSRAAGAAAGIALVFTISMEALGADKPPMLTREEWGAQTWEAWAKKYRISPPKVPSEKTIVKKYRDPLTPEERAAGKKSEKMWKIPNTISLPRSA